MKNAVFRGVTPCGFVINRSFGGTCRLCLQDRRNNVNEEKCRLLQSVISSTLNMEETRSSETSVYNKPTRRHIPNDGIIKVIVRTCRGRDMYVHEYCGKQSHL
jgi:hypothetical protein